MLWDCQVQAGWLLSGLVAQSAPEVYALDSRLWLGPRPFPKRFTQFSQCPTPTASLLPALASFPPWAVNSIRSGITLRIKIPVSGL